MVETVQKDDVNKMSMLTFNPATTGVVTCAAKNAVGYAEITANVIVNDLNDAFIVWSPTEIPVADEEISIICGATIYIYTEVNWYFNDVLVENSTGK